MQVEYATDVVFRRPADLAPLYEELVHTAVHAVKADRVATFLGRKLDPRYQGEVGNHFHTCIQGTRIEAGGAQAGSLAPADGRQDRLEITTDTGIQFGHHRRAGCWCGRPPQAGETVVFHAVGNAANAGDSPLGDYICAATATSRPR